MFGFPGTFFVVNIAQDCIGQRRNVGSRKCLTLLAPTRVEAVPMNTQPSIEPISRFEPTIVGSTLLLEVRLFE